MRSSIKIIMGIAVCMALSALSFSQNVMIIKYNDGNSRIEEIGNVEELIFAEFGNVEDDTPNDVSRGLVAYYTFDNKDVKDSQGAFHGFQNGGTFILDTPSGDGYALGLKPNQFFSIGSAPLDGRTNYSVSMWVKDFGTGCLIRSPRNKYDKAPSLRVTEDIKLMFCTGDNNYSGTTFTYSADMSNYQAGQWVMLTIVCEPTNGQIKSTLYVNGRRADSGVSSRSNAAGGKSMIIGGDDSIQIDNIRLYSVALSDEEVMEIYCSENR